MTKIDFIRGMRPKTLAAAIVPPLCAQALVIYETGQGDYKITILCLLLAVCIQIATNFYNDAVDFEKGADEDRVGPKRISSVENVKTIYLIGHIFIALAFIIGIPLVMKGGPIIAVLGVISLYLAYGYTGGPFPLAYLGLGEVFVFIFFGIVATLGTYYLLTLSISISALVLSTQIGLISCALIAINNFRDRKKDIKVGKNTLATKMSDNGFKNIILFFLFFPYIMALFFVFKYDLIFIALILSVVNSINTLKLLNNYQKEEELNLALAGTGKQLLMFGFIFIAICI